MSFISFDYSARSAVDSIQSLSSQIQKYQEQIATGRRINSASDSPSIWGLSQTIASDVASLEAVQNSLGTAQATLAGAVAGGDQVTDLLTELRAVVVAATDAGADHTQLQSDADDLLAQIERVVGTSQLGGVNLLSGGQTFTTLTGITRDSGGVMSTTELTITGRDLRISDGSGELNILNGLDISNASNAATALTTVDTGLDIAIDAAAGFGRDQNRLHLQDNFVTGMINSLNEGVSSLVDVDLNETSILLQAAETQRDLAISALRISQDQTAAILRLFL